MQALPSEQLTVLLACAQPVCGLQESLVQTLLSLQLSCWQLKAQLPPPVQAWPAGQLRAALS